MRTQGQSAQDREKVLRENAIKRADKLKIKNEALGNMQGVDKLEYDIASLKKSISSIEYDMKSGRYNNIALEEKRHNLITVYNIKKNELAKLQGDSNNEAE